MYEVQPKGPKTRRAPKGPLVSGAQIKLKILEDLFILRSNKAPLKQFRVFGPSKWKESFKFNRSFIFYRHGGG